MHISDLSWVQNFNQPQEVYKKGDTLETVVMNVDTETERFSLSLKQLQQSPWEKIRSNYPEGTSVPGTAAQIHGGGAVVTLEEGVAGFLPKTKCPKDLKVGDKLNVTVQTADEEGRKLHLKRVEE